MPVSAANSSLGPFQPPVPDEGRTRPSDHADKVAHEDTQAPAAFGENPAPAPSPDDRGEKASEAYPPTLQHSPDAERLHYRLNGTPKAERAKNEVYQAGGGVPTNLNGRALFRNLKNHQIVCRHLALWVGMKQGKEYRAGKPAGRGAFQKTLVENLGETGKISSNVPHEMEALYAALHARAPQRAIVAADWSGFLEGQFEKMGPRGHREILVLTHNHAMLLTLRTKLGVDGQTKYVGKFYDPNTTLDYHRIMTDNPKELCEKFNLETLLCHGKHDVYKPNLICCVTIPDDPTSLLAASHSGLRSFSPLEVTQGAQDLLSGGNCTSEDLYLAALINNPVIVRAILQQPRVDVNFAREDCGYTPLTVAAAFNHEDVLGLLINAPGLDANRHGQGLTALEYAIKNGRQDAGVALIVSEKIDINQNGTNGRPLMFMAMLYGQQKIIEALVAHPGFDPSHHDQGLAALSFAIEHGNADLAENLTWRQGIDVNSRSMNGQSPLVWAARKGDLNVLEAVLNSPRLDINHERQGFEALEEAARKNATELVKALLAHPEINEDALGLPINAPGLDANRHDQGLTALEYAIKNGRQDAGAALIESEKIDINQNGTSGRPLMFMAIRYGQQKIIEALVAHPGFDPSHHDQGLAALSFAIEHGNADLAENLTWRQGIDVNSRSMNGQSPLVWAARKGDLSVLEAVLNSPSLDINHERQGVEALEKAARKNSTEIVKALLTHPDINLNVPDKDGMTPLMAAAQSGSEAFFDMLLAVPGIDVNRQSILGETALSLAVVGRKMGMVKRLLAVPGVDIDIKTDLGNPRRVAKRLGQKDFVTVLDGHRRAKIAESGGNATHPLKVVAHWLRNTLGIRPQS